MSAINTINTLIKQLEPKLDFLAEQIQYPQFANKAKIESESTAIKVLVEEIISVAEKTGSRSVLLTPFYLKGRKLSLHEVIGTAGDLIKMAKRL